MSGLDRHDWVSIVLIFVALVPHMLLAVDRWVHRQSESHGELDGRCKRLAERTDAVEQALAAARRTMSDEGGRQQARVGGMELQLARIEEHLKSNDREIDSLAGRRHRDRPGARD